MSTRVRRLLAVSGALWRLGFAETAAYRVSLLIWIVTAIFPLISLVLWRALAESGPIGDYDQDGFDSYFIAAFLVRQLGASWVVWELDRHVRTGELSTLLMRPVSPVLHYVLFNAATVPVRMALATPIALAVLVMTGGATVLADPWLWPLVVLSIALAWLLNFLVQLVVGCLAFWLTKASSLFEIWLGLFIVLSGYTVPTSLFPGGLAEVARVLPFHAVLGFPVELVVGRLGLHEALQGLALQAGWIAIVGILAAVAWRRGLRAYGAFGT
jgi:ABC-2 type transport system permease protein